MPPSLNFPQFDFVKPSSGFHPVTWKHVNLATKLAKWPRIQKKAIAIIRKKILSVNEDIDLFLLVGESVATLLWPSVGVKPNTWKK